MKHGKRPTLIILTSIVFIWWMFFTENRADDVYLLKQSISETCYLYSKNVITGNLCHDICQGRALVIEHCLSCKSDYKVFSGKMFFPDNGEASVLIKQFREENQEKYLTPESNTTIESLQMKILSNLQIRFGRKQFDSLVLSILRVGDHDRDGGISLPEARSVWALLKSNDFLMTIALAENDQVPDLLGYCGNIFLTDRLSSDNLHDIMSGWGLFSSVPWVKRVLLTVSLLEFVEDIQDLSVGNLLLCSISDSGIGMTVGNEVSFYNLEWFRTEADIARDLKYRSCTTHSDCTYGSSCYAQCISEGVCVNSGVRTNLKNACELVDKFVQNGSPRSFLPKLESLLARCKTLDQNRKDFHLEHSLILSDLKNSLWEQINLR
ncbi:Protein FAM69A [Holothuria leucospilota]|uniref:Protein FAM69A n=1 Tax=Holothuria leucospilota TaxID=206669 RepID=A0A9Q1HBT6_HOLLE|nr:Protein FAM69A [Holothuria leucospilota]